MNTKGVEDGMSDEMQDDNDITRDVRNGFICAEWRQVGEGPILDFETMKRRQVVMRCDRPDGHKGDHVDSVLLVNWPAAVPVAQPAVPVEERTTPTFTDSQIYDILDRLNVAGVGPQGITKAIWKNGKVVDVVPDRWVMEFAEAIHDLAQANPIPEERTAEMEQLIPEYLLTDARTDYDSLVAAITALGWNPPGTSPESQNVPVECVVNIHQNGVIAKTVITTGRYEDEEDGPDFHPELGREWGGIDVVLWRPVTASDMEELAGRLREAAHELIVRQLHWKSEVHELPQAADACPGLDASKAKFAAEASPENILKLLDHIEGKAKAEEVQE